MPHAQIIGILYHISCINLLASGIEFDKDRLVLGIFSKSLTQRCHAATLGSSKIKKSGVLPWSFKYFFITVPIHLGSESIIPIATFG
ncbi:MAG: hypothetical protein WCG25_08170 [bacterium]